MEAESKKHTVPFWNELLQELNDELERIEQGSESTINKAQQAILVCKRLLNLLAEAVSDYPFTNAQEEIHFFREVKPQFLSRMLYYGRLFTIEAGLPVGNRTDREAYLQKELARIKEFFDDNKFFYQYFRSGETYLDEKLFLRREENSFPLQIYDVHADPAFSTGFDYVLSRIKANEMLLAYLNKALDAMCNEPATAPKEVGKPAKTLQWTEAKSALIELIYAFKARGSFNNGKATLKEITDYLQLVFGVEITNPSRDFQDILSRKRSVTIYLDGLKESYLKYIEGMEERR